MEKDIKDENAENDGVEDVTSTGVEPIEVVITVHDIEKSTRATATSGQEIITAYKNFDKYGVDGAQTTGDTFFDLPARYGRDPYQFNESVCGHFKNTTQYALICGEFGLSPNKLQSEDALKEQLDFLASCGVRRFQNFNAQNTIAFMRGVPMMTRELVEENENYSDLYVMGGICVQENPDTAARQQEILDDIYKFAELLLKTGHKDFYVENANGVLTRPEFVQAIFEGLHQRFDEDTHFNTANTYGYGYQSALAATEAGVTRIGFATDALGDGAGQPSIEKFYCMAEKSRNKTVVERLPRTLNLNAIMNDHNEQVVMRGLHSHRELPFHRELLADLEAAGSAGSAATSIKPTTPEVLWDRMADHFGGDVAVLQAIARQKVQNRAWLGYPTNVRLTENMQDVQACADVCNGVDHSEGYKVQPLTIKYLNGGMGAVSPTANPKAIAVAKKWLPEGRDTEEILPIDSREPMLPEASNLISQASQKEGLSTAVTKREALIVAVLGRENGLKHVMDARKGILKEMDVPKLPVSLSSDEDLLEMVPAMFTIAYDLLEKHKLESGFYKNAGEAQDILAGQYGDVINEYVAAINEYAQDVELTVQQMQKIKRTVALLSHDIGVPSAAAAAVTSNFIHGHAMSSQVNSAPSWGESEENPSVDTYDL